MFGFHNTEPEIRYVDLSTGRGPTEVQIRAVALVAAALAPYPGDGDLYERAEEHATYIREGLVGKPEEPI